METKKIPAKKKVAKKKVAKKKVAKKTTIKRSTPEQRMDVHEVECALRYKRIEERLDSGNEKFDKLEKLVWGIYPFIIVLFIVEKFAG
jgi:hypothetical protein